MVWPGAGYNWWTGLKSTSIDLATDGYLGSGTYDNLIYTST